MLLFFRNARLITSGEEEGRRGFIGTPYEDYAAVGTRRGCNRSPLTGYESIADASLRESVSREHEVARMRSGLYSSASLSVNGNSEQLIFKKGSCIGPALF